MSKLLKMFPEEDDHELLSKIEIAEAILQIRAHALRRLMRMTSERRREVIERGELDEMLLDLIHDIAVNLTSRR